VGVQDRSSPAAPGNLDVQERLGRRFSGTAPDDASVLVALKDVGRAQGAFRDRAGRDGQP
jgi:hypothetical protein